MNGHGYKNGWYAERAARNQLSIRRAEALHALRSWCAFRYRSHDAASARTRAAGRDRLAVGIRTAVRPSGQETPGRRSGFYVFADLVERHGLHRLCSASSLCEGRAWLHLHRIDYSHLEERMKLGAVAHDLAKPRDSSVEGLMGLAPDRIDWAERCVIEAKHKAGAKDAVGMQTAFYALLLSVATGKPWRAENDILSQSATASERRRDRRSMLALPAGGGAASARPRHPTPSATDIDPAATVPVRVVRSMEPVYRQNAISAGRQTLPSGGRGAQEACPGGGNCAISSLREKRVDESLLGLRAEQAFG